jgi:hypothetical protein
MGIRVEKQAKMSGGQIPRKIEKFFQLPGSKQALRVANRCEGRTAQGLDGGGLSSL